MDIEEHGGGCCGVRHIYGFDNGTEAELDRLMAELLLADRHNHATRDSGRLIEVILSERQVTGDRAPARGWPAILQERGFGLVSRFNNANSGKNCYIFHYVPNFMSIRSGDLPFEWQHPRGTPNTAATVAPPPPPPAAPPLRVVLTTYHNVLRTGRGREFGSIEAARASAPRARQIDKREFMSDGSIRWTEDVG